MPTINRNEGKDKFILIQIIFEFFGDMVELVDMLDLGSSASRRVGSTPSILTKKNGISSLIPFFVYTSFKIVKK